MRAVRSVSVARQAKLAHRHRASFEVIKRQSIEKGNGFNECRADDTDDGNFRPFPSSRRMIASTPHMFTCLHVDSGIGASCR